MSIIEDIRNRIKNILWEEEFKETTKRGKGFIVVRINRFNEINYAQTTYNTIMGDVSGYNMYVSVRINNELIFSREKVNGVGFSFNFSNPQKNLGIFSIEEKRIYMEYNGYVEVKERTNRLVEIYIRGWD
jgi:hypothetical protein